jgi:hypothetical protein
MNQAIPLTWAYLCATDILLVKVALASRRDEISKSSGTCGHFTHPYFLCLSAALTGRRALYPRDAL